MNTFAALTSERHSIGRDFSILDLSKIYGISAVLSRIPCGIPGVYAWYRNFNLPSLESSSPDEYASLIIQEVERQHCVPRSVRLAPSHKIAFESYQKIPGKKKDALKYYCKNVEFRKRLNGVLAASVLYQSPLYIGKATSLQSRIAAHLKPDSILRTRLNKAGIDLLACKLIFYAMEKTAEIKDDIPPEAILSADDDVEEDNDLMRDEIGMGPELVLEDLMSRLFNPLFTIRYG